MRARLALCCALLAGCPAWAADEDVAPFRDGGEARPVLEEEDRVWAEGERGEKALLKSGHVHAQAALSDYLQKVLDRLYPEFRGKTRVKVINDSGLNAFAFPHGAIFFNMGLLARLDNEAQLATILAHEGAHFTYRHSFRNHQSAKGMSGFAMTAGLLGGNVAALLGNLAAVSSMSGFSQDMEREADRRGFDRLAKAGYDVREAVKCFRLLAEEARVLDSKEPFFFASHPRLQERIESFEALIADYQGPEGDAGADRFARNTRGLREEWLQAQIGAGKPKSVIHVLTDPDLRGRYSAHALYYLGEAYRLRAEEGDAERSLEAWNTALQEAPDFTPTYRALGVHAMKRQEWKQAKAQFDHYLQRAPQARDADYVRSYLEIVEEKLKP